MQLIINQNTETESRLRLESSLSKPKKPTAPLLVGGDDDELSKVAPRSLEIDVEGSLFEETEVSLLELRVKSKLAVLQASFFLIIELQ